MKSGCAIFLLGAVAFGQQARVWDIAAVGRGRAQFKSNCGFCHGDDATGNRAPDLIRSALMGHDVNGDLVAPVIKNGRPDKEMPAFPTLSDAAIADIVLFLHKQADDALHSNGVPNDYPLAKLLTGNANDGKAYFNGAGGCSDCHSSTGDLAGLAKRFGPIGLQQRFLYPGFGARVTASLTLKDGQKIEGRVVHHDEFEIGMIGPDGWFRSWPVTELKSIEIHDPMAAHRALMQKYTDKDIHNLFAYLVTL
ncbi:MAG TPA: c-type cytochrome [Bryobacteraceae bacterium]|jgi:cytochrome c oxidase cbb3-type subunit 3|nr:c-type cytochrome [Bryobacteraceae bacterium]